jgi:hypothetical protein
VDSGEPVGCAAHIVVVVANQGAPDKLGCISPPWTGHAKADQVRMARDVATMFDELKALANRHAELHTDRARLQAELEQARRPWWQRLVKVLTISK